MFHEKPSKHLNIKKLTNLTANTKNYGQITLNTKSHTDPLCTIVLLDHTTARAVVLSSGTVTVSMFTTIVVESIRQYLKKIYC